MKPKSGVVLAVLLASAASAFAHSPAPTFRQYTVSEKAPARTAAPQLSGEREREFTTVLRSAAKRRPNFAGRYVLTEIGCGASCVMLAALDAKTGDVVWWPGTLCCWELAVKEPVEFRRGSELLILHGQVDEAGPAGPHYWRLTGGQVVQVKP